jgi:predicted DNA-binding protein
MSSRISRLPESRKPVAFRLPVDLLRRVDAAAAKLGQSRTTYVIRALEAALRRKRP